MPTPSHPDLLVGTDTGDDAAVWRLAPKRALVATVDFFTPIVDDPRVWGRVAAANSASDVFAMGGRPLFALNVVGWPRGTLPLEVLAEVMAGAAETAASGGWVVGGGHSVDTPEPLFGQCVLGEVHPDRMMTNDRARPGEAVVLTKALGTGVVATAVKRLEPSATRPGGAIYVAYEAAVESMTRLNAAAAAAAVDAGARAATDVTGFGLVGHLHKMALASDVAVDLDLAALPLLPGVEDLVAGGFVPGGTTRNQEFVADHLRLGPGVDAERWLPLLADPQTSGGLLFTCAPRAAAATVAALRASGHAAAVVGATRAGRAGKLDVA